MFEIVPAFVPESDETQRHVIRRHAFRDGAENGRNWNDATAELEPWDCGRKVGPATPRRPGLEVRMHDGETVELALYALDA